MEGVAQSGAEFVHLPVVCHEASTPFSQNTVQLTQQEYVELKWQAHYWKAQHARALDRAAAWKREAEKWQARVRDLKQRLYGKKSERSSVVTALHKPKPSRPRGHQRGVPGHGRTEHSHLAVVEEERDLTAAEKRCSVCGKSFLPFPKTEDSTIVEIQVRAHIRKIQRRQYLKGCDCEGRRGIITAPAAARLIPKSSLGVSVWTSVLLDKYLYSRPTHRLCQDLAHQGLAIAQGTLTGGLKKLCALFEPLVAAMYEQQMTEQRFHADETRWEVFEEVEGKVGHRWYLWITQSASVVYYRMAPSRAAAVPKAHFAPLGTEIQEVILVCDRYVAYKCLAEDNVVIVLAFCWAHVRRDFLEAARRWPMLEEWMLTWVEDIGELYALNARRVALRAEHKSLADQSVAFLQRHGELSQKLAQMEQRRDAHLQESELHKAQKKVLESLKAHWEGLTVFVRYPEVAMDNNTAERAARNPVTGRKNYYGSGRVWSAHLAAMMFTLLQSVLLWGLNPCHWLHAFLQACAENEGKPPRVLSPFLPWAMSEARKQELSRPLAVDWPVPSCPREATAEPEILDTS